MFKNNLELVCELQLGMLDDTGGRDLLIDCVTSELKIKKWPTYSQDQKETEKFMESLKKALSENGGELLEDVPVQSKRKIKNM